MARVLVLTDRDPTDESWKGALTWQIIQSLAESQHEVLVASPLTAERLTLTHPRLTIARPVTSWRADQVLQLARLLFTWRPEVIQTFAPVRTGLWPAFSVWPALAGVLKALPHIRRVSTLFDEEDWREGSASFAWHQSANEVTVFSERHRTRAEVRFGRQVRVLPLELPTAEIDLPSLHPGVARAPADLASGTIIPAPVSEWRDSEMSVKRLARYLNEDESRTVHVLGGWGDWTASQRKRGWIDLQAVAGRVHFHPGMALPIFASVVRSAESLWMEPMRLDSWRFLLATHLGAQHGRKMILPGAWAPTVSVGSTANSLSRMYVGMNSSDGPLP